MSLSSFFQPKSIAVVGVSRDTKKVGHQIFKNLLSYTKGKVYPINPTALSILGNIVYKSVTDVPDDVQLVIIAVPTPYVEQVVDECIEKRVQNVLIISAGFAETSPQGKALQESIAGKLAEHNIGLIGPNSLGYLYPHNALNASFANQKISAGSLALISQSGAMLTALFTEMESNQVGSSFAISLGNKAGISEIEALEFAESDPHTKVIGLYLESFNNIPQFFELCSRISKKKPIILLKGGRTKSGQTASVSHTAALATNDVLLKAGIDQFGYVLVDTVEEFMRALFFLEQQRSLPENTLIITNAGGPGVNTVDVGEMRAVTLASWSPKSVERIEEEFPNLHVANPLDVLGDATADRFSLAIRQAQTDPQIDSILVIITQQAVTHIPSIIEMMISIKGKKPLCVALIGGDRFDTYRKTLRKAGILCTEYPNQIINILSVIKRTAEAKYIEGTFKPGRTHDNVSLQHASIANSISKTFELLGSYGIQTPIFSVVSNEKQLSQVHLPSYAKTANLALPHKKDVGAIYGVVRTREEVTKSFEQLKQFGDVLYQQVIEADLELLLGVNRDDQFGPYIAIGLGGSWTNVLSDRSYSFLPTTKKIFMKKLQHTKAFAALQKLSKEYGFDVMKKVVTRMNYLQTLMHDHPEIKELEINPLMINQEGIWAADVKIKEV